MRSIFLFAAILLYIPVAGQVLNLEEIEFSVEHYKSGNYKDQLISLGFLLTDVKKEGESGLYEKWTRESDSLQVTIQYSDSFKFTKLTVSSTEPTNDSYLKSILNEVTKSYSKKTIDDQSYYLNEGKPELTVHVVSLEKKDPTVEEIIFFRKY
ncbi:MAG: hypothetical protein ACNS60_01885 [Candidatus Cyclobacteriaceae bacterium M2_1C_046]